MQNYTVGLVFNNDRSQIALIRKKRPIWQAGRLNGVGGKLEHGEMAPEGMAREAREEMDLDIHPNDWHYLTTLVVNESRVYFFTAFDVDLFDLKALTDEEIVLVNIEEVFNPYGEHYKFIMPNIRTVIGMALDMSNGYDTKGFEWVRQA